MRSRFLILVFCLAAWGCPTDAKPRPGQFDRVRRHPDASLMDTMDTGADTPADTGYTGNDAAGVDAEPDAGFLPEDAGHTPGTLVQVTFTGTTADGILLPGREQLLAQYSVASLGLDASRVYSVPVVNDPMGALETAQEQGVTESVSIETPQSLHGNAYLVGGEGTAILSPEIEVAEDPRMPTPLYLTADVPEVFGNPGMSGRTLRIGLRPNHAAFRVFAVDAMIYQEGVAVINGDRQPTWTIRRTKLTFARIDQGNILNNGMVGLFGLRATCDRAGPCGLARIVFVIHTAGLGSARADLDEFRLVRNGTLVSIQEVNLYGRDEFDRHTPRQLQFGAGLDEVFNAARTGDGQDGDGVEDGAYAVIMSFEAEDAIAAGQSQDYLLRGTLTGGTAGDSVRVCIRADTRPLAGFTELAPNTGYIYVQNDPGRGIFTRTATAFSRDVGDDRNVIISDNAIVDDNSFVADDGAVRPPEAAGGPEYYNAYAHGIERVGCQTLTVR